MNRRQGGAHHVNIEPRMMLLFILPCLVLGIIIHELGHACAATVVGSRVKEISIGRGTPIASFVIGGCRIHLFRNLLGGGKCIPIPRKERFYRVRMFVVLIAGVLAQVMAFIVVRSLVDPRSLVQTSFALAFALVTLVSLIVNLWPSTKNGQPNDGRQIFDLFSMSAAQVRWIVGEADTTAFALDVMDFDRTGRSAETLAVVAPYAEKNPGSAQAHYLHAHGLSHHARYPEALAATRRSLLIIEGDQSVMRTFRHGVENSAAYYMSLIGDPHQLAEAHRLAESAHRGLDMPATAGTLGSVLVQIGEPDEGLRLLEFSRADLPSSLELFETERFVMIGHLAKLDVDAARSAFDRAMDIPEILDGRRENLALILGAAEAMR